MNPTDDNNVSGTDLSASTTNTNLSGESTDTPKHHQEGGWEVVEEISEELPIETHHEVDPSQTFSTVEPIPPTENAIENSTSLSDNSSEPPESEAITMSSTHDYAQQHLDHFEDTPESVAGGGGDQYYHYPKSPRKIPYLLIGGVVLGVIGLGLIAKLVISSGASSQNSPATADVLIESTSGSPTPIPTASPKPEENVKKTDLKIQALNGSGITGAASKLAKVLEGAEYGDITTGNAPSYDASGVRIQVKDGQLKVGETIEKDLEGDYENITVRDTLDADSEYDVVITLGKQPEDEKTGTVEGASDSADLKSASDKKTSD